MHRGLLISAISIFAFRNEYVRDGDFGVHCPLNFIFCARLIDCVDSS